MSLAHTATVSPKSANEKLTKFLKDQFPVQIASIAQAARLISNGQVSVNGKIVQKAVYKLKAADIVAIKTAKKGEGSRTGGPERDFFAKLGIHVHFENRDLAIVWKPSGISVGKSQRGSSEQSIEASLPSLLSPAPPSSTSNDDSSLEQDEGRCEPRCISFLDRATAGLVICAKTQEAYRMIGQLYKEGLVTETWKALCVGHVGDTRKLAPFETFEITNKIDDTEAITLCTFLEATRARNYPGGYISTILASPIQESTPLCGQVRQHLSQTHGGHPHVLVGAPPSDTPTPAAERGDYLALIEIELDLLHPDGRTEPIHVRAEEPKKFKTLKKREEETWLARRNQDLEELRTFRLQHGMNGEIPKDDETKLDEGVPIPYIVGEKDFFGLSFIVSPAVMIPRVGTETLIQCGIDAAMRLRGDPSQPPHHAIRAIDLGTGSGCVLLSILKHLPNSTGLGLDLSEQALAVAAQNGQKILGAAGASRAVFAKGAFQDVAAVAEASYLQGPNDDSRLIDVVVSNPPYLARSLVQSNRLYAQQRHEPELALAGGDDGFQAFREIKHGLAQLGCRGWLRAGAECIIEIIGSDMGEKVKEIFLDIDSQQTGSDDETAAQGKWKYLQIHSDPKGIPRCVSFAWRAKKHGV
ncbi:S-adenosyl-L-methionine-dependent methyltransferase [Polychytrium aggregatum]|uniref:S-adenosyl-L-methionine-dependent methyltransferase n=1 Tax=Polychytrium aggregatum TaxID=110093 RepID=UPI0022FEC2E8|nr:S-adenosyl-L-methionine-dependent methyltransferase [Polychytrium aggregatum]KAI9208439.1 S-adenosyl-L-methionine-dependent methyltransferase [Polychytrium aggregatum]